jgi:hypothetical protein
VRLWCPLRKQRTLERLRAVHDVRRGPAVRVHVGDLAAHVADAVAAGEPRELDRAQHAEGPALAIDERPIGREPESQPFVSVAPPVPEQCAAWPMNVSAPAVNTKLEVHWAPSVKVMLPGRMLALSTGVHA